MRRLGRLIAAKWLGELSRGRRLPCTRAGCRVSPLLGAAEAAEAADAAVTGLHAGGRAVRAYVKELARGVPLLAAGLAHARRRAIGALDTPKLEGVKALLANCVAHGRRQFVEVVDNFPEECRHVLETLRGVYRHDALAREQELSPEDRLRFHQEHSGPLMKGLHAWMEAQLAEHKTDPNSGLGKAISYLLNHWPKLTLFLQQPDAPLDNNIVERSLKKAILNRKN